jgi:hypothetical protein
MVDGGTLSAKSRVDVGEQIGGEMGRWWGVVSRIAHVYIGSVQQDIAIPPPARP